MLNFHPKHTGIYYVQDNIENLQFKIHFRAINTLLKLPKFDFQSAAVSSSGNASYEDECATVILQWQQKLLSQTERELYNDLKNCATEQQRKYHALLKEEEKAEKKRGRRKRQRKQAKKEQEQAAEIHTKPNVIFTYVHEDNFQPSNDTLTSRKFNRNKDANYESMYVYADLKPDKELVALKWLKDEKLLIIYPDFNDFRQQPYFIELDTDYRHLYSYAVEDVSPKKPTSKGQVEKFLYLPELATHWRYDEELSQKFAMPPKRTQRCALLFNIDDLQGFEYSNLHVRYSIQLPANTIVEEGLLESSTHTTSAFNSASCHIGLPWQVTLLCEEQFKPSDYMKIFFEIISIDSWQRERLEGLAYYSLNLMKPLKAKVLLQCIRPQESFMDSLNRYFIGGRKKFDYIGFWQQDSRANEHQDEGMPDLHCRYGIRMKNTGQLRFSCESLTQRNCELLNPCASRTSGMTLDDIMMAYKEARWRLEAISLQR